MPDQHETCTPDFILCSSSDAMDLRLSETPLQVRLTLLLTPQQTRVDLLCRHVQVILVLSKFSFLTDAAGTPLATDSKGLSEGS